MDLKSKPKMSLMDHIAMGETLKYHRIVIMKMFVRISNAYGTSKKTSHRLDRALSIVDHIKNEMDNQVYRDSLGEKSGTWNGFIKFDNMGLLNNIYYADYNTITIQSCGDDVSYVVTRREISMSDTVSKEFSGSFDENIHNLKKRKLSIEEHKMVAEYVNRAREWSYRNWFVLSGVYGAKFKATKLFKKLGPALDKIIIEMQEQFKKDYIDEDNPYYLSGCFQYE